MARPPDDQPTVFSEQAARTVQAEAAIVGAPRDVARGTSAIAKRTGVVFVHGIGTQAPAETFLDWSGPIVDLLTDWRAGQAGDDPKARIDDPVWRAEFAFNAASPPYLELAIPTRDQIPATTWVFTEAWWAADLRAPNIGRTIDYLRRRMRSVVSDIAAGYYRGRNERLKERAQADAVIGPDPQPLDWRLVEGLDLVQSRTFGSPILGWLVGGIGVLALAAYDVLRRVPLPFIRDFAVRRMVDSFLIDWFGDLPVLLDDNVQAANVRARLARSIQRLVDDGCDAVVVVAHSGGALVSFETLLDPAYAHLPVDKLITLGQGLGLAWRLAEDLEVHEITPGNRLVGDLAAIRPKLRWVDFWASYDPAPAGPLPAREIEGTPDQVAATLSASKLTSVATGDRETRHWLVQAPVALPAETPFEPPEGTIMVESRPVTNEMNVLTDHGAYWANPEGFLVPLVRHLDAARGDASASRFYQDGPDRTRRIIWRRERVAALAAWGWVCTLATIATTVALIVLQATGDRRLTLAGDSLVALWDRIPGHEIVSGPVVAVGAVLGGVLEVLGLGRLADALASLGPPVVGVALAIGLFYALVKVGLGRWHDWDQRERRASHPEIPSLPDRSVAGAQAMLLLGGLIGLVVAMFGLAQAAGLVIVLGAAAGAVVWWRHALRPTPVAKS